MTSSIRVLIYSFLFLVIIGCKKEINSVPTIKIEKPTSGQTYYVPDEVVVKARVSDPDLKSIKVELIDQNSISVLPSQWVKVTSTTMDFQINYPIYDKELSTGIYSIKVTAANSEYIKTSYQEIYLIGVPLHLKGFFVAGNNGSQGEWMFVDSTGTQILQPPLSYSITGMCVDSKFSNVCLAKSGPEVIDNIYAEDFSVSNWSILKSQVNGANVERLQWLNSQYFASFSNGVIRWYRYSGVINGTVTLPNGFIAKEFYSTSDQVTVYAENAMGAKSLFTLNPLTQNISNAVLVGKKVRDIIFYNDEWWILQVDAQGTELRTFNPSSNFPGSLFFSSTHVLNDALSINGNSQIWATNNGVYQFSTNPIGLIQTDSDIVNHLYFERVSNRVVYQKDNQIDFKFYPSFQPSYSLNTNFTIEYFDFWYNK